MCGRVRLSSDVSEIKLVFSIPPNRPTPNIAPSWNVAPTDPLPVVRYDAKAGERSLDVMRWGLVPFWAKDIKVGFANINAKAEGIENKPAFREAFQRRRCLIPVDNFYEWGREAALCDRTGRPGADGSGRVVGKLAFAGRRVGTQLRDHHDDTKRLVRRAPQPDASGPGPQVWSEWLGEEPVGLPRSKTLLAPYPAEEMTRWPVSTRVGSVKNNDPSLIEPIAAAE
jgi:putative SOS response-associated peptidase YedK